MGRILGARKPVTQLYKRRFWAWYLQKKRKLRALLQPCLDDLVFWSTWKTIKTDSATYLGNANGTVTTNPTVHGYAGTFDGTAKLVDATLTGSETVVNSDGTATPTVGVGEITFTAGCCGLLELSNGNLYVIQSAPDSTQTNVYDKVNKNVAVLDGETVPFFTTKIDYSTLAEYGFGHNITDGNELVTDTDWPTNEVV